jgi:hypothetical protein
LFCVLMTSFLFFDGPRSASEIDFVSQTKRRPDSRPTKHQKEERVRRGGVDTQRRTPRRKVQSLLYACCSGVGVARPQSATSHTLAADTFNVSKKLSLSVVLAFLWLLRRKKVLSPRPVLHDAIGSSVRCWLWLLGVFSSLEPRKRGERERRTMRDAIWSREARARKRISVQGQRCVYFSVGGGGGRKTRSRAKSFFRREQCHAQGSSS